MRLRGGHRVYEYITLRFEACRHDRPVGFLDPGPRLNLSRC